MCGIVGLYYRDRNQKVDEATLRAMCRAIVHRGPDDEGVFVDGNFGMGMRRLSVVDLASGHQPIFNEDGRIAVVYNGEIFNYPDLKSELQGLGHDFRTKSDTETLVHGYESWGDGLPGRLNGMFAFCVWDAERHRFLLARDHVGIKPLYVYEDAHRVAWASEIKSLFAVPGISPELEFDALFDFMTFGYVPAPRTMFRGIRKFLPAHLMAVDGETCVEKEYWNLSFTSEQRSHDEWCEALQSLIDDAVRRQLMSDVPLGAFLSGGIDSSTIVATMRRLGVDRVSTYSIGFGGKDAFHSELASASEIANAFETDHHEIVVEPDVAELIGPLIRHLDEPVTDTSFLVTYLVSKLARESVTVILSGVGGDEVFAGYRRYLWPEFARMHRWVPGLVDRHLLRPLVRALPVDRGSALKSMLRYTRGFLEHADLPDAARYQGYVGIFSNGDGERVLSPELGERRRAYQGDQVARYYEAAVASNPLNRMLYADLKTSLVDSLLTFTDKMSMAVSLEARVPLLDYRILELAAKMPANVKLRGVRGMKHILKRAMADRLPLSVLHRRKRGFGTPISRWFRGQLRPLLQDMLSPERIGRRGYFDANAVWKLIDDHCEERADYSEHILALLTFEVWHQTFLDGYTV